MFILPFPKTPYCRNFQQNTYKIFIYLFQKNGISILVEFLYLQAGITKFLLVFLGEKNYGGRRHWKATLCVPGTVHNVPESCCFFPTFKTFISARSGFITLFITTARLMCIIQGWASVLFKRMFRSLRSFAFFIKECSVLCILLRSL